MIYLQDPIHLPYTVPMKFRMGRTTLTLQVRVLSFPFSIMYINQSM